MKLTTKHLATFADQGITSLTTMVVSTLVASQSTAAGFGEFAVFYSILWLGMGLVRAAIGESSFATDSDGERGLRPNGGAISLGLLSGLIVAAVALVVGSAMGSAIVTLGGVASVFIIGQDISRYLCFSLNRAHLALASDSLMLATLVAIGLLLPGVGGERWMLAWGISALLGLACVVLIVKPTFGPRSTRIWVRTHGKLSRLVALDFMILSGAQQLIVLVIPLIASLSVLGSLKAGQVAIAPLNVLLSAVSLAVLPAMYRNPSSSLKMWVAACVAIGAASITYVGALFLMPHGWLTIALGDSWAVGSQVVWILGLQFVPMAIAQIGGYIMRVLGFARLNIVWRCIVLPATVFPPLFGAAIAGATGAAWGLVVGAGCSALTWALLVIAYWRTSQHNSA